MGILFFDFRHQKFVLTNTYGIFLKLLDTWGLCENSIEYLKSCIKIHHRLLHQRTHKI